MIFFYTYTSGIYLEITIKVFSSSRLEQMQRFTVRYYAERVYMLYLHQIPTLRAQGTIWRWKWKKWESLRG